MPNTEATKIELLKQELQMITEQNTKDHKDLKDCLNKIDIKLDDVIKNKTDQSEFLFWRNTLIIGMIISIFLMLVGVYLGK